MSHLDAGKIVNVMLTVVQCPPAEWFAAGIYLLKKEKFTFP